MKTILSAILLFFILITPAYSQFDDIFDKVKKEAEKIKKEQDKEKEKKKEEKKKKEEEKSRIPQIDTVYESEYHRMHAGEIFFCKEDNPNLKSEINFENNFANEDNITACVYLKTPVAFYPVYDNSGIEIKKHYEREYFLKFYIDEVQQGKPLYQYLESDDYNSNSFYLHIRSQKYSSLASSSNFDVYKLEGGSYKVRVELWGGKPESYSTKEPVAKGEFVFNKIVKEEEITGRFSSIPAGMKNSTLEQQALNEINRIAENENWKERYSKAKITSYDWTIVRNEWTGIITHRKIYMVLYGTWPNGICRYTEFSFFEEYDGSKYSSYLQYNAIGDMYRVECE